MYGLLDAASASLRPWRTAMTGRRRPRRSTDSASKSRFSESGRPGKLTASVNSFKRRRNANANGRAGAATRSRLTARRAA